MNLLEESFANGRTVGYCEGLKDGKPKWIPVTERLPDKSMGNCSEEVLVDDGGIILIGWYDYATREWCADEYFSLERVNAWMTLPDPYKPGEN